MKIAYLSTFYPFRGGIAQFNALLYKAFEKLGKKVKAFTFTCQYPEFLFPGKTQFVTPSDKAIPINSTRILHTANPFSYEKTAKEIIKWQPDILIMKFWMTFFGPSLGHVAKKLRKKGTKVICVVDNAIPHEPRFFDKFLTKLLFNQCNGFIVMSKSVQEDLLNIKPDAHYLYSPHPLYNHFGEKIEHDKALSLLELDNTKKTLLFFGLIRDYKGLDLLIDAMSLLDESYQLIIAGETYGSFDKYEKQITSSSANKRIKVMNQYIDDDQVPILFSAADLLVLPYKSATQSGVIPVAYHFNVPILATDVGGLRETLESPGTGIICQPDAESISTGIKLVFEKKTNTFIENIEKEKKKLSWEIFAEKIISFAEKL